MRYEAKHHYFKHLAIVIGNFINLPFSLAKRHQESVAYKLMTAAGNLSSFIEKGVEVGPGKYYCILTQSNKQQSLYSVFTLLYIKPSLLYCRSVT